MTTSRTLKKRIRERMKVTGESYTRARAALLDGGAVVPEVRPVKDTDGPISPTSGFPSPEEERIMRECEQDTGEGGEE